MGLLATQVVPFNTVLICVLLILVVAVIVDVTDAVNLFIFNFILIFVHGTMRPHL